MGQIGLFDGTEKLTIRKPIRLIELFAGYGSQHFALEYLGVPFESYKICEWAVKSIQAYKDAHFGSDTTDYSKDLEKEKIVDFLFEKGISMDYNVPMTREQIVRMGYEKQRTIYNNIVATHNLVSVCNCHAKDLEIVDTDKYEYILTYSFPCQDISKVGKLAGMQKGSGTRSGLLWEVERILDECENLPQILVMENVPDVIGTRNINDFKLWYQKLASLGYTSKYEILNAKDYGVPQNRERCFMVSYLGNDWYEFPQKQELKLKLKDLLETEIDKKYYLKDETVEYYIKHTIEFKEKGKGYKFTATDGNCVGKTIRTRAGCHMEDNFIVFDDYNSKPRDKCVLVKYGSYYTLENKKGGVNREVACAKTTREGRTRAEELTIGQDYTKCRIRKLTPRECFRLMGVKDADFDKIAQNQSDSSLYHLAGDSIVVDVLVGIFKNML